uniref:Uncharacterized protein n=2 Tax=Vibrio TaxID=662 RepID=A0A0H3ZQC5_9VIBR|nr:hypothetical protein [Vibrio tasmaniensis]AKN40812.1 hypothetical protein [Vibrio sp. 1F_189]
MSSPSVISPKEDIGTITVIGVILDLTAKGDKAYEATILKHYKHW